MMSDREIKEAVLRELTWDTQVEATEVGVEVDHGVVTLTGTVSSYGKKSAAQNAAHQVFGVYDVVNVIEVNVRGKQARSDTELAHMVRQSLEWDGRVPDDRITSTVEHGVITLEGRVDVWAQCEKAERTVRHLTGVTEVINRIQVAPPIIAPSQVQQTIQDALARRATHEAKYIRVGVEGGTVTLSGRVQSWLEKRAILGAVSHAPGVQAVNDQLRIGLSR